MALVHLPTELILMIETNLDSPEDIKAFIFASPRFTLMFNDKLYKNLTAHEYAYIVLWAAKGGLDVTICQCLNAGAKITQRDRFRSHLADRDATEALNVIPERPKPHPLAKLAQHTSHF